MTKTQKRRYMAAWRRAHPEHMRRRYIAWAQRKNGYNGNLGVPLGIAWQRIVAKVLG